MGFIISSHNNKKYSKNIALNFIMKYLSKFKFLTITNIKTIDDLIYFSYNLTFAIRIHHLPIHDDYKLPKQILESFAYKYFSNPEKELLAACQAYNDTLEFRKSNPSFKNFKISTGKEVVVMIYHPHNNKEYREFKINDLSKFSGLCRRYKSPEEVEKIIMRIFEKGNNV